MVILWTESLFPVLSNFGVNDIVTDLLTRPLNLVIKTGQMALHFAALHVQFYWKFEA